MSSTALLRGLAPTWISGANYAVGDQAWSAISGHVYRCIVAVSSATDPSADATNWKLIGPGGIKSRQSGEANTLNFVNTTFTVTLAAAVNPDACEVRLLGFRNASSTTSQVALAGAQPTLALTSATTLTIRRGDASAGGSALASGQVFVAWEVVERWK